MPLQSTTDGGQDEEFFACHLKALSTLPLELIHLIASYIECRQDVLSLAVTSSAIHQLIGHHARYHTVQACVSDGRMWDELSRSSFHPDAVRVLRLFASPGQRPRLPPPSNPEVNPRYGLADRLKADLVRRLWNLRTFEWYGHAVVISPTTNHPEPTLGAYEDCIWNALRDHSPELTSIQTRGYFHCGQPATGTFWGAASPSTSQIYSFKNLTDLHLEGRCPFANRGHVCDPTPLYTLLAACPNLKALTLKADPSSPIPTDHFATFQDLHFHQLQTLSLSNVPDGTFGASGLTSFLSAHPGITSLTLINQALDPPIPSPSPLLPNLNKLTANGPYFVKGLKMPLPDGTRRPLKYQWTSAMIVNRSWMEW